jgi:hypothetical protein
MYVHIDRFSKEMKQMRKRQIISEKLQGEMEAEIEVLRR